MTNDRPARRGRGREVIEITKTETQALVGKACPKDAELRRVCQVFYAEEYGSDKCRECWAAWEKMAAQAGKGVGK